MSRHGVPVLHWQDAVDDLDETAALMYAVDVVITVQSAVAHLAGALGRPAWVMLSHVPEWRYMACGDTMPWYPSIRLFRQPESGDWASVIQAVAGRLAELSCQRR
jgi:hypothetical protein